MIINREGQKFELTPEELEQAYRERLRQYTEEDAEVHFLLALMANQNLRRMYPPRRKRTLPMNTDLPY